MAHTERLGFKEFRRRFENESDCKNYLLHSRWAAGFVCPRCGRQQYSYIKTRSVLQCSHCRHQSSLTAGTVMHKTHLPLAVWFWAIYLTARDKRGISATQLSSELEISYASAWYLLKRIRQAMSNRDQQYLLSGIVELDDTYWGAAAKGGKRGRGTAKLKIAVAVSKSSSGKPLFARMKVIPDLKGDTIASFAKQVIRPKSTIQSDAYHSYRKPLGENYDHQYQVFDSNGEMLHWLHLIIGNAKSFLQGTYHGNCRGQLQSYLDEFCYRLNRRFHRDQLFTRLLCAVSRPCTAEQSR